MEKENIPTYCMSCKKHMSGPEGDYNQASHGICPDCLENWLKEFEQTHPNAREVYDNVKVQESVINMSFKDFVINKLRKI